MDQQPKISEPEVIIIHCDDDNSQFVPKKHMKNGKKQMKRKVQIDSTDNKRLIITQKVKTKKFQCIINLTNICKHKHKNKATLESFGHEKGKTDDLRRNRALERVTPRCMRKMCRSSTRSKRCSERAKKSCSKKENVNYCSKPKKNVSNRVLLSPDYVIDLSEEMPSISYENISSDSLSLTDNELDTLIKRTRDREKLLTTFDSSSPLSWSPPRVEISSEVDNIQCIESASIHSVATLMLEPRSNLYSPTNPTMSPAQMYSPTQISVSPNKCDSEDKYSINLMPEEYTNNIKDIALENNPVKVEGAQRNVCVKKEPYSPVIIPTDNEYFAIDNSFYMKTPKSEILSPTIKSDLLQENSFYSASTEISIKKEPCSHLNNISNTYLRPFLNTDNTSHVEPFHGNAEVISGNLLYVKTEDSNCINLPTMTKEN